MKQVSMFKTKTKVELSIERIRKFEPEEGYYLGFSGGKDSICCYHLLKMAGVKFDGHYNVTGIDHPELVYFIRENYPDIKFEMHKKSIFKLIIENKTPPMRQSRYCCAELKEGGGEGRFVINGVRWAESNKRKNSRTVIENFHKNKKYQIHTNDNTEGRMLLENCIKKGKFILNPIVDWEDEDVWDFIKGNNIKYPDLYDKGWKRLGCIGCPNHSETARRKDFLRYPKFEQNYIKAFDKMLVERKKAGLETTWKTGKEVFEWWVLNKSQEKDITFENQIKFEFAK